MIIIINQNHSILLRIVVVHVQVFFSLYVRLRIKKSVLTTSGLCETLIIDNKGLVRCTIHPNHKCDLILELKAVVLRKITSDMPSSKIPNDVVQQYQELL